MSGSNPFARSNFNPDNAPVSAAVVFDANGIIDDGGLTNPGALGYNVTYVDQMIENDWAGAGLSDYVWDVSAQFPGATYSIAVNSAVTVVGQGTTYYSDHGLQGTAGNDVILDHAGNNIVNSGSGTQIASVFEYTGVCSSNCAKTLHLGSG